LALEVGLHLGSARLSGHFCGFNVEADKEEMMEILDRALSWPEERQAENVRVVELLEE
jgi:hypothetical protein